MKVFGIVLAVIGATVALYAALIFDVSVSGDYGGGRVNNIGLMSDRQNLLIVGCTIAVVGVLLALFTKPKEHLLPVFDANGNITRRPLTGAEEPGYARARLCIEADNANALQTNLTDFNIPANAMFPDGQGLLHRAVGWGAKQCVELLLAHGADPDLKDSSGHPASDYALTPEIQALLQAAPVRVEAPAEPAVEPLMQGLLGDQLKVLADLHARGALNDAEFAAAKTKLLA